MNEKTVKYILKKIKEREIPEEILPVFELIQEHPGRLHFVKDHNGCRNVLFFSAHPKEKFAHENPYFSIYTFNRKGEPINIKVSHYPKEIYNDTKLFLENTNEVLYVCVRFQESVLTNLDYFSIFNLMEENDCNLLDAYVSLRRFPDWYAKEADYPLHVLQQTSVLLEMEKRELNYLLEKREALVDKLSTVVKKNDISQFNELSNQMRKISKQISEYKK